MDYDSNSEAGDTPSMGFQSQGVSRAASTDPEAGPSHGAGGFDAATPRSAFDDDEPQELDPSDLDPINSGAVTPAVVEAAAPVKRSKALNFLKKKETKVRPSRLVELEPDLTLLAPTDHQRPSLHRLER